MPLAAARVFADDELSGWCVRLEQGALGAEATLDAVEALEEGVGVGQRARVHVAAREHELDEAAARDRVALAQTDHHFVGAHAHRDLNDL